MKQLILGVLGACLALPALAQEVPALTGGIRAEVSPRPKVTRPARPMGNRAEAMTLVGATPVAAAPDVPAPPAAVTIAAPRAAQQRNVTRTYAYSRERINADGAVTLTGVQEQDDPMKAKTFSKSFSIDKNDKVNLSNEFGSITIKTWNKNEIKVDGDLKAYASTEEEAQKLLDAANVSATKEGDLISFKGDIGERNGNWGNGNRNGKRWRREVKIHLIVYMPATNALTASQKYGNITLDDFSGATLLKVEFGDLIAGDLNSTNNNISVQYGKARLKNVNQAKINHRFGGGIAIESANVINMDAQYTGVDIGAIKGSSTFKHRFGKGLTIGSAGPLTLDVEYAGVKCAALKGNLNAKMSFGRLKIDEIESGCKSFTVNAAHTPVNLNFDSNYNGSFDVSTSYGGFTYGSNVTAKRLGEEDRNYNPNRSYNGQIGKGGSGNVNVKTEFGSVTFNK